MPNAKSNSKRSTRRRRKIVHPLTRQHEQKPIAPPQMMARERILSQLHDLIVACDELFEEHGPACTCEGCCVVSNMVGALRMFRMVLEIS